MTAAEARRKAEDKQNTDYTYFVLEDIRQALESKEYVTSVVISSHMMTRVTREHLKKLGYSIFEYKDPDRRQLVCRISW